MNDFFISIGYKKESDRITKEWEKKYKNSWFIRKLKEKIIELGTEEKAVEYGKTLKLDKGLTEIFGNGQTLCHYLFWELVREGKIKW